MGDGSEKKKCVERQRGMKRCGLRLWCGCGSRRNRNFELLKALKMVFGLRLS